ncbi:hypothetical protein BDN72DRAFT_293470 [Pluteus cervinus]|uniref:Uncharacterized protein n=1 Tax=Pluteus cervinus TaxID=181527 RepID=A0ACD3B4W5_9AGAR|nr:hypothetical protein BDN72DRAFT_293470 [Pluteus cervinus]
MTSITRNFPWFIKDFGVSTIGRISEPLRYQIPSIWAFYRTRDRSCYWRVYHEAPRLLLSALINARSTRGQHSRWKRSHIRKSLPTHSGTLCHSQHTAKTSSSPFKTP